MLVSFCQALVTKKGRSYCSNRTHNTQQSRHIIIQFCPHMVYDFVGCVFPNRTKQQRRFDLASTQKHMAGVELLSDQGFRIDGRRPHELRKIECRLGVFRQADGSAYIEQGNTKVLAAVYGPHEVRGGRGKALHDKVVVNCQYSMATFSTGERKRRPRGDRKSQEMTMHLQQTFDATILTTLYPRSQIDIFVEVLQADGGNYCASVNAATLALIDAGIPLKDYVCASSAGFVRDTALVDMNHLEESSGGTELIIATLPKSQQIVFLEMNSRLHEDNLSAVMDRAVAGCTDVYNVLDTAVRDHVGETAAAIGGDAA